MAAKKPTKIKAGVQNRRDKSALLDELKYMVPTSDAGWFALANNYANDYFWVDDMLAIHEALHARFGGEAEVDPSIIVFERWLSSELRSRGFEHRYTDPLSEKAGTLVEDPRPVSLEEASWYLERITLHTGAVKLVTGVPEEGAPRIWIDSPFINDALAGVIARTVNKGMPPGIELPLYTGPAPSEEFLKIFNTHDLVLRRSWDEPMVVPSGAREALLKSRPSALAKSVAKSKDGRVAQANIRLLTKAEDDEERYVLGVVLQPDKEDLQGDIYNRVEVRKAAHWWMEHANGQLAYGHTTLDGRFVTKSEVAVLETYLLPADANIGGYDVPAGTWLLGARVKCDDLWFKFKSGELNGWSIGAYATETPEIV